MREMMYALRFTGQETPSSADGNVLKSTATATGSMLIATIGPEGLSCAVHPVDGGEATLTSEVTITSGTSFQQVGTIGFGGGHRLHFSTVRGGYLASSVDPARKHGAVMWRVTGGEGQFAGASGLIASNFLVGLDLTVTDYHLGVILLA